MSPVPSSIDFSTPLPGHHLMLTSLLDWSKGIIRPMKDGNGKRTFELGPIVTMSCHLWDSNSKNKTNQILRNKTLPFLVCLKSKLRGNQPQARVAPNETSQANEPPIPGLSPSSESHEDVWTPEGAPTQSMEEPFTCPAPPNSVIITNDTPVGSPRRSLPFPPRTQPPPPLIATMRLTRNSLTCNQH
ncbi:hypothetical protein O181_077374 [Austropuccinia psidii MF-1]|uniref:Uncharacterized protein n=1 Tax=Austropuccinia psidii MF-1 TaxID=1389203 RepID=A0A9Q3FEC7_9BASI|nr:hypothetical protein [Austropuccinia psidii MF-1]